MAADMEAVGLLRVQLCDCLYAMIAYSVLEHTGFTFSSTV